MNGTDDLHIIGKPGEQADQKTGDCWSTERSREVAELFMKYHSLSRVAEELQMSTALVSMYLPYQKVAYDLDEKSANARRCARWKERNSQE